MLGPAALSGQRVLEIGCGSGVNLLSLQGLVDIVGVETELFALECSAVFARLEALPPPRRVCAPAEALPFGDNCFDLTLFFGSLQYMHCERALREAARVLVPGGRLVAILSDQRQAARQALRRAQATAWHARTLAHEVRGLLGQLVHPWLGRLLLPPAGQVHPTRRRMQSWLADAGLHFDAAASGTLGDEACFVAEKPAR